MGDERWPYRNLPVRRGSLAERAVDLIRETDLCSATEAVDKLAELAGVAEMVEEART